jgi:hypothetical protein
VTEFSKATITHPPQGEHLLRVVQKKIWRDHELEVVTGYDISQDRYPVHMYVTPIGGARQKLDRGLVYANDVREAQRLGWKEIGEHLASLGHG